MYVCMYVCMYVGMYVCMYVCIRRVSGAEQKYSLSKAKVKHGRVVTKWMCDRYVLGFAPALRFLRSQILCRLYKSPSGETINRGPPVCIRMQKDHIRTLKILWSMSEFGGLWKHQNNPACTKSVSVQNVET